MKLHQATTCENLVEPKPPMSFPLWSSDKNLQSRASWMKSLRYDADESLSNFPFK